MFIEENVDSRETYWDITVSHSPVVTVPIRKKLVLIVATSDNDL